MIKVIVETSGAQRGSLFTTNEENELVVSLRLSPPFPSPALYSSCFFNSVYISGEYYEKPKGERGAEAATEQDGRTTEEEKGGRKQGVTGEEGANIIVGYADGIPFQEWVGPQSVVNFSKRTVKPILLSCAKDDYQFGNDPYVMKVILSFFFRGREERRGENVIGLTHICRIA